MISGKKKIHFVGIGGIGMSGIARVLLEMGRKVSGSDVEASDITRRLELAGGEVFRGHCSSNISKDVGLLVYSSSISDNNPEIKEARRKNIKIVHRAKVLGELFNKKKGLAITGTHGKTTTASLVSVILKKAELDPTVIIGGEVKQFQGNAKLGKGKHLVAEADESDSSFLALKPFYAIITNIELEHLDHYRDLEHIKRSYRSFVDNIKKGGVVFYNYEDRNIKDVLAGFKPRTMSFGFSKEADIYPIDIRMDGFNTSFRCVYKGDVLGEVVLNIPGKHNVLNCLAAMLTGLEIGLSFKVIRGAVAEFEGAKRRFQLRTQAGGIMLIDDYAHHPTEIAAVLDACRNWKNKRIIAIFQPHRYTRTKFLADEFGKCFNAVDKLILTDIYAASEKAIDGISIKNIYDKIKENGVSDVSVISKSEIVDHVLSIKKDGDMILVLGAGDIKKVADDLCARLESEMASEEILLQFKSNVSGKVIATEPLSKHTSFRIGGVADIWVEPKNINDLRRALKLTEKTRMPLFIIGNGSNLLVSDSGFRGVVISLAAEHFKKVTIDGNKVLVGGGFSLPKLVRLCCEKGLGGLESLVGIPGTAGGAIWMNAGGSVNPVYKNIGEVVEFVKIVDYNGKTMKIGRKGLVFGYRTSNLGDCVIVEAQLKLKKMDRDILLSSRQHFLAIKKEKQVLDTPSAGCVFKNPPGFQFTCGQMIDILGLKGKRIGGAEISPKHANFIINMGKATYRDVASLIELVKDKVKDNYNISLEMEVKVI